MPRPTMIFRKVTETLIYFHRIVTFSSILVLSGMAGHALAQPEDGSCAQVTGSAVARYLDGAELQAETDAQLRTVKRALVDMLRLPPAALKKQRYPDYQGHAQKWTARQVLEHHFVPTTPMSLTDESLVNECSKREARAAIRRQLVDVEDALNSLHKSGKFSRP